MEATKEANPSAIVPAVRFSILLVSLPVNTVGVDWPAEWTQANLRTFSAHTLAPRPNMAITCPHLFIVIYFEPLVSVLPFLRPGVAGRQHAYAIHMA